MNEPFMRRVAAGCLTLVVVTTVAACGDSDDRGATLPTTPASTAPAAVHEDTGVVTSEVPINSAADSTLADMANNWTPEQFLEGLPPEDIDAVGGQACALEMASISLAVSRWVVNNNNEPPTSLDEIADDPKLANLKLWTLDNTQVVPVPGSGCIGPYPLLAPS